MMHRTLISTLRREGLPMPKGTREGKVVKWRVVGPSGTTARWETHATWGDAGFQTVRGLRIESPDGTFDFDQLGKTVVSALKGAPL